MIFLDPDQIPFEVLKTPLHYYQNPADAPQWLHDNNELIKQADGFILLSSEYNATIPPALTNMMDHFPPSSFRHKPAGVVTYSMGRWCRRWQCKEQTIILANIKISGKFGASRASVAIMPFLNELGMVNIPTGVTIPTVQTALNEKGEANEEKVIQRVDKLITELKWYVEAVKAQKTVSPTPS